MTDQRRTLLAFILMGLVLAATQWWYSRIEPTPEEAPVVTAPESPAPEEAARRPVERTPAGPPAAPADPPAVEPTPVATPIVVETPLYRATIDPVGGGLRSFVVTAYPSFTDTGPVTLIPDGDRFLARFADVGDGPRSLADRVFVADRPAIVLARGGEVERLTLRAADGAPIVQTFAFDPSTYVIDYTLDMGGGNGVLYTTVGPGLRSNEKNVNDDHNQMRGVARVDGEIVSRKADQVEEEDFAVGGVIDWAGLKSKYFLALLLSSGEPDGLSTTRMASVTRDSLERVEVTVGAPIRDGRARYRLYFGPQEYQRLARLNEGLDNVNQYGWSWIRWMITPFAKLCVIVMLWLHQFIPSYGLVLIVFALLIRVLMWPLTTKSYASIRAMQQLQPELQRLRERYKSDPQKMQQETMRMYREKKVNPLGGCLPNLIPMPILFALFFVFQGTIEFRGAPFLWLPDLSQPDPFYILPLFMGLTIYATSKISATDPKMAAMTYVMPVVLTFVFLNLAAGLVLYYAFSNLLTFAQQWMLKQRFDKNIEPEPQPAEA